MSSFHAPSTSNRRNFHTKRPIDKKMINIWHGSVDNSQHQTVLQTFTFPGTITGLRCSICVEKVLGTAVGRAKWAIVIVRESQTAGALAVGNATTFYLPETDCLMFGHFNTHLVSNTTCWDQSTKTMRKMQGGDQLLFLCHAESATEEFDFGGVIQWFVKT